MDSVKRQDFRALEVADWWDQDPLLYIRLLLSFISPLCFIFFLLQSAKYLGIPKRTKGRALSVFFGQNLKEKLALETSMVVVSFRMLMREPQG